MATATPIRHRRVTESSARRVEPQHAQGGYGAHEQFGLKRGGSALDSSENARGGQILRS